MIDRYYRYFFFLFFFFFIVFTVIRAYEVKSSTKKNLTTRDDTAIAFKSWFGGIPVGT